MPGDIILIVEVGEDGSPADGTFLSGDYRVIPLVRRKGCYTEIVNLFIRYVYMILIIYT